ncbi:MAG: hemerythrin family protein [Georgfuchsia sp.]
MTEDCKIVTPKTSRSTDTSPASELDPSSQRDRIPPLQYAEWSDRFELGIPRIDQQHRKFFDLAASFNDESNEVRVLKTLATLGDYIRIHLRDEEALMAAAHYPGLEVHCRLHDNLRQMLSALLGRARQMTLDEIAGEVKYLVNGWFSQHIVTADQEFAPYVVSEHPSRPRDIAG